MNEHGLDRKIVKTYPRLDIHQWNQLLIRLDRVAANRIVVKQSRETLHPSDFIIMAKWAYESPSEYNNEPDNKHPPEDTPKP